MVKKKQKKKQLQHGIFDRQISVDVRSHYFSTNLGIVFVGANPEGYSAYPSY